MQVQHTTTKIVRTTLVATLLATAVLDVCQAAAPKPASTDAQGASPNSLVIGTTDEIVSLDPAQTYEFHSWEILRNVGGGLLDYVPGTTDLTPGLATGMPEVSSDGTVYTFTLHSGLTFPDGEPLNAQAVKWSIERVAALGGAPSWFVTGFLAQVDALDETTVRFELQDASHVFPHVVAGTPYFPVSPSCFPGDAFDEDSTCGGLGPYTITSWTPGSSMVLNANPRYPGVAPRTPSITIRYFDSASTLRQALEDGEIDIAWKTLSATDYQELDADPDFTVVRGGGSYIRCLCFNTTTQPFDSADVRSAVAAAVDREATARDVYADTKSGLYSMVPEGMWSHVDAFHDRFGQRDLTDARALLQQAGYSETNKLELDLWYPLVHYGPEEPDLAAALEADIEETGMVSVTTHSANWSDYLDRYLPVFLLGWWPDYPDPDNYTWSFAHSSSSGSLGIYYEDAQMDSLLEAGRSTIPVQGPARRAIYEDIQTLWAEKVPTIPLLQGGETAVTRDRVRGVEISPLGTLAYSYLWWDGRVSTTLEPETDGGLTSEDGDTALQFPAGAVTDTVVVTHTPVADVHPGGNLSSFGEVFELTAVYSDSGEAAQIAPGHIYTVTVHYSDTEIGPTIEETLGLYWWDESGEAWSQTGITSTVNVTDDVVSAQVAHFSRFAVLGETERVYLPMVLRYH